MAKIFLESNEHFTLASGASSVYGANGAERLTLLANVTQVTLDQNVEAVVLPNASSSYLFLQRGNQLEIFSGAQKIVQLGVQGDADGTSIAFSDATLSAKLETNGTMRVGQAIVSATNPAPLSASGTGGPLPPAIDAASKSRTNTGIDTESLLSRDAAIVRALDASRIESDWRWQKAIVTYSFNTTLPADYAQERVDTTAWRPFPAELMPVVERIMAHADSLVAISLLRTQSDGDIRFNVQSLPANASQNGYGYYPSSSSKLGGDVFLNSEISPTSTTFNRAHEGFYGFKTIVHELGHALGLKHPFAEADDPAGDVNLAPTSDHRVHTIMSYTDFRHLVPQFSSARGADGRDTVRVEFEQVFPRSFMVYDIAALQALYGPERNTNLGHNIYFFDPPGTVRTALYIEGAVYYPLPVYVTLWDSGGEDTIDLAATKHPNTVRLMPGSYSDIDLRPVEVQIREQQDQFAQELGTRYFDNWVRNVLTKESDRLYTGEKALGIAYGTIIENAVGGSANDNFYDNFVDNKLFGREGDDRFFLGQGGYDTVNGGAGQDTVVLPVARGSVTLQQSGNETIVVAERFAAKLIGVERIEFLDTQLMLA